MSTKRAEALCMLDSSDSLHWHPGRSHASDATGTIELLPFTHFRRPNSLIWLGDADPQGHPLHPEIRELGYQKEADLIRYRAAEMKDEALVASLIEEAVYRTSRAAHRLSLSDPGAYLYCTYRRLVDQTLQGAVLVVNVDDSVLDQFPCAQCAEEDLINAMARDQTLDSLDHKGREILRGLILGYQVRELANREGQSPECIRKRLRRSVDRAFRRTVIRP